MLLRETLERLARRIWRERWNPIAHAEFLRSFSWRKVVGLILAQLLCYGIVILLWRYEDFAEASAAARFILGLGWFVGVALASSRANLMFQTDNRLEVTEAWLLTSEPRENILASRLAGLSLSGPMLIVGLGPLYYLGALGMSANAGPLFVCGNVARFGSAGAEANPEAVAAATAALLAAAAMLADLTASQAYAAITMPSGLYQAAARRLGFFPLHAPFRYGRLFLCGMGVNVLALLAEVGLAVGAGYWFWGAKLWRLPPAVDVLLSLLVSALCAGLLIVVRRRLARAGLRTTARHYDHTLITDGPE